MIQKRMLAVLKTNVMARLIVHIKYISEMKRDSAKTFFGKSRLNSRIKYLPFEGCILCLLFVKEDILSIPIQ